MEKQVSSGINVSLSTRFRFREVKRQQDIDKFLKLKQECELFSEKISKEGIKQLKSVYLHGISGRNSHNQLVVVDRIGNVKLNEITKIMDEDTFILYTLSRLVFLSEEVLREKERIVWVFDLRGKIMQLASKKVYTLLAKIIKQAVEFFPNILARMLFVNTAVLFDTVWNQLSNEIPQSTHNKVQFLNNEEQLYEYVDKLILPGFLGGEVDDSFLVDGDINHLNAAAVRNQGQVQDNIIQEKTNQKKQPLEEEDQQEQWQPEQVDFSSLKAALSGMSFGKSLNVGGIPSVAQTPLNTQADQR